MQKTTEEKYIDLTNDRNLDRYTKEIELDMDEFWTFSSVFNGSSYGLAAPCPVNVIAGRDYSADESKFDYWKSVNQGNVAQYEVEANARRSDMEKCVSSVKKDAKRAARYVQLSTRNYRSNGVLPSKPFVDHSLDLTGKTYNSANAFGNNMANPFANSTPFSAGATNTANPFGQQLSSVNPPSSISSSNFERPAFGTFNGSNDASSNSNSIFGKPAFGTSSFGSQNNSIASPFGQLQNNNASGFGQITATSAQPFASKAFQQPAQSSFDSNSSAFGKPTFGNQTTTQNATNGLSKSVFGQTPSQPSFGSTSGAFGSPAFGQNTFGQPSFGSSSLQPVPASNTANSTAQQPSQPAFGQSAFGQSAFGQSAFGQPAFGKPAEVQSPFGVRTGAEVAGQSAFGLSAFGQSASEQSAFGNPTSELAGNTQEAPKSSAPFGQQNSLNSPFSTPASSRPFGSASTSTGFGALPSSQQTFNQSNTSQELHRYIQGLDDKSEITNISDLSEKTIAIFKNSRFDLGEIPEVPPPLELTTQ
ncbi:unnamed protein product [Kluyveromyces dobzhanskii CBS 2104]|uniref:WGS project CCBQ000000000 data, contig 00049 n=1 Tax=Kluyveromyces dobzhanskii CBS 2104 TaxID=1427455 RepID=A0A0A8L581_9SACH|nr:unnamed protein product [Kluyveromyces dobzhanskii CBS 2104]